MIVSIANRLKDVEEYYFSKKIEEIQRMKACGIDVINLGIGSPDLSPPPTAITKAQEVIGRRNSHGYSTYRSSIELRQSMSEWLKNFYHIEANYKNEILPLLGSKEGILYLSMAILNPGDGVLVPNPGYPTYSSASKLIGAKILNYDLKEENSWLPDFDQLEKMDLSNCKLMWINYPHMPTGQKADERNFEKIISFAKDKKILICNDNPYGLVLNTEGPKSIFSSDPKKEFSCELNSLSKSFNMAGWRIGMLVGAQDLIDAVVRVKSNVDSGMFSAIQEAAIAALGVNREWHDERNNIYRSRRQIVWEIFDLLNFRYDRNQVGLFVWAKAPERISDVQIFIDDLLTKAHVFLTPGIIFGSNGSQYARASLCAPEETLLEAKKRIKEYCK